MITAVAFTPDGRFAIAGCLNGLCNLYETDGLKLVTQIHLRSGRPRKAKGCKITGVDTINVPSNDPKGVVKVLVTSNDSRIRLYNLRDQALEAKFRGNENTCSQIRASFSENGKHVICGSEDRRTYIWSTDQPDKDLEKREAAVLETQSSMVTAAIMAPGNAKQTLGFSEDPIYDVCNPPPVTLVSRPLPTAGDNTNPRNGGATNGGGTAAEEPPESMKMAEKSPTYLARSTHPDGDIIITADYSGRIKVLRQDCAYHKRRTHQIDFGRSLSRRLLRRSDSARRSFSSIGRESSHKTPSERIIAWRNSVIRNGGGSIDSSRHGESRPRSTSPHASPYSSPGGVSSGIRTDRRSAFAESSPASPISAQSSDEATTATGHGQQRMVPKIMQPTKETEDKNDKNEKSRRLSSWTADDQSYLYWKKLTHDAMAANSKKSPHLLDPASSIGPASTPDRRTSASTLSSDSIVSGNGEPEHDVLKCDNCHGKSFHAAKSRDGKQRLVCTGCLRPIMT